MYERFTERARHVVELAQTEAAQTGAAHTGTEHLLLGCLLEEEGLACRALGPHLSASELRTDILGRYPARHAAPSQGGSRQTSPTPPLSLTAEAKVALELSLREALSLGHNYIGTEHVLLALVHGEGESEAKALLRHHEISREDIRNEVIRMLRGPSPPPLRAADPKPDFDEVRAYTKAGIRVLLTVVDALTEALDAAARENEALARTHIDEAENRLDRKAAGMLRKARLALDE